jgi:hypothetical protein
MPISRAFIPTALLALAIAFIALQMWMREAITAEVALAAITPNAAPQPEASLVIPVQAAGPADDVVSAPPLSEGELDALIAPVALYPDPLLAQIFMASTYPLEVVQASRWVESNPNLKGEALTAAVANKDWDPSIKSLVATPSVLKQMSDQLEWTQSMGDAFLAQQGDVMACVQRLRRQAQSAGSLQTTQQQRVVTTGQTIVIEPAQPDVVYVPYYNPTVVYGSWGYSSYPPYTWPPPPGYAFGSAVASGIGFGVGLAIAGDVFDGGFNWGRGDIDINVNRNTNINRNVNRTTWKHDAAHRRGVNYRDSTSRQKFAKTDARGATARQDFRGHSHTTTRAAASRTEKRTGGRVTSKQTAANGRSTAGTRTATASRGTASAGAARTGRISSQSSRATATQRGHSSSFSGVNQSSHALASSSRGKSSRQASASRGGGGRRGR